MRFLSLRPLNFNDEAEFVARQYPIRFDVCGEGASPEQAHIECENPAYSRFILDFLINSLPKD